MDSAVFALLTTCISGVLWFTLCVVSRVFLRKYTTKHIESDESNYIPKNALFSEADTPLMTLIKQTWKVDISSLREQCGVECYFYLMLHVFAILSIGIIGIIGIAALVPVYTKGSIDSLNQLGNVGMSNIIKDNELMVAPVAVFILFSLVGYSMVYFAMISVHKKKANLVIDI